MAEREKKLGRGLESLISAVTTRVDPPAALAAGAAPPPGRNKIPVGRIDPNPWQPRRDFGVAELEALVRSIQTHGLLQPILVRRQGERFTLISGERRWRATQELGQATIDAVVVEATDRQMLEWAIVENLQRADLGPIETAEAYRRLILEFNLTQEEVAQRVGQSRPQVGNTLRLLELPAAIKEMVSRGTITAGAARALLSVKDPREQLAIAEKVGRGEFTVRDVERQAAVAARVHGAPVGRPEDADLAAAGEELQRVLGTKVRIVGTARRGRVVVDYFSASDLDRIYQMLRGTWIGPPPDQEDAQGAQGAIGV